MMSNGLGSSLHESLLPCESCLQLGVITQRNVSIVINIEA